MALPRLPALQKAAARAIFVLQHEDNTATAIAARIQEGLYDFGLIHRKFARSEPDAAELGVPKEILIASRTSLPPPSRRHRL